MAVGIIISSWINRILRIKKKKQQAIDEKREMEQQAINDWKAELQRYGRATYEK